MTALTSALKEINQGNRLNMKQCLQLNWEPSTWSKSKF